MLRLALLALAGTSARQRKEKCELNLPALATKKVPALLSYTSSNDTLAFVSGGQLTLYGQLLPTTRINFGGAVEVLSTDATAIPFFVGIYHRLIAPSPQALLRVRISSPKVVLTNTVRVGMAKADFLGLFFQHLTADELHCLSNYHIFTNADPVGVYINQTFVFRSDTLRESQMQLPEMARSEEKPAQ